MVRLLRRRQATPVASVIAGAVAYVSASVCTSVASKKRQDHKTLDEEMCRSHVLLLNLNVMLLVMNSELSNHNFRMVNLLNDLSQLMGIRGNVLEAHVVSVKGRPNFVPPNWPPLLGFDYKQVKVFYDLRPQFFHQLFHGFG
jgi:hypothetical protein